MKVEIIEKGEDWIKLKVKGINYSLANAIRRSSYEIYMPAIDELEIHANDSILYDEILANRLGLIPLKPNREINIKEKCGCKGKGCRKCTLKIKLEAKGPGMVYAGQISGEAKPLFKDIPIVWLEQGQELKLIATITMGKALQHSKYQAGLLTYSPSFMLLDFNKEFIENNERIKEILKKFSLELKKGMELNEKQYEILDWIKENYPETKIKLEISEKDFIFYIETYSYLTPKEIFIKSLDSLYENLSGVSKKLKL